MVTFFKDSDDTITILNEILNSGIVGIQGGRLAVRKKIKITKELANKENNKNIYFCSTIDHPHTELGYIYDEEKFDMFEAKNIIESKYNEKLRITK